MLLLLSFIVLLFILLIIFRKKNDPPIHSPGNTSTSSHIKMEKRHRDAARYIRESGDRFALSELEQIQHRPEAYNYYFNKYAHENPTLKIALGLVAGYLTWEALNEDNRNVEVEAILERLDMDLENDLIPDEGDIVEQEERALGIVYDDSDYVEVLSADENEMDRLYADLDDTQYFEDMMDEED